MKKLDYKETVLSQYADSEILKSLMSSFSDDISIDPDWVNVNLLNPETCTKYILTKIAQRWGVNSPMLLVPLMENHDFLYDTDDGYGFYTPTGDGGTFNIKVARPKQYVTLSSEHLLKLMYVNATIATTVPSISVMNKIIAKMFFGRGNCWIDVSEIDEFVLTWKFAFELNNQEKLLLQNGLFNFLSGYEFRYEDNV